MGKISWSKASSIRFYILQAQMRPIVVLMSFFLWIHGFGQIPQSLKGIWRQPERGLTLQLEQHGQYVFGKVIGIGRQKQLGALTFDSGVKPGHFALTELRFIRPGIWLGRWNSGGNQGEGKRILLKSLSPDCWQLYFKGGPCWFKIKEGKFVPEK